LCHNRTVEIEHCNHLAALLKNSPLLSRCQESPRA
jgi:hypothetical protein